MKNVHYAHILPITDKSLLGGECSESQSNVLAYSRFYEQLVTKLLNRRAQLNKNLDNKF